MTTMMENDHESPLSLSGVAATAAAAAAAAPPVLHFTGTINTDGGGFCSLRATLPQDWNNNGAKEQDDISVVGVRLRYRGDGKTYKFLLSDGVRGRSIAKRPTWQCDLPTAATMDTWQERDIYFSELLPAFGGGPRNQPTDEEKAACVFHAHEMTEVGFMLSLRLSDGSPNPVSTFGQGIFPFSLQIESMEPIFASQDESKETCSAP